MRKLTPKPQGKVLQRLVAPTIVGTTLFVGGVACETEPPTDDSEYEVVGVPTTDDPPAPEFPDEPGDGGTVDGGTVDG